MPPSPPGMVPSITGHWTCTTASTISILTALYWHPAPAFALAMTRVTKGRTAKAGSPYLVCAKAKAGAGCQYKAVRMEIVDAVVQVQWPVILGTIPGGDGGMYRKLEKLEQDAAAARDQAEKVTEA